MALDINQVSILRELWYKYCSELTGYERQGASSWMTEIRNNKEDQAFITELLNHADEEDYKNPEIAQMLQNLKSFSALL